MGRRGKVANSESVDTTLKPDWNYEAKVAEVEKIIAQIEAGELELEEVFEQFTAAVEYLRQCETFLQQRQQQVDLLIETLSDEPV
ncbi:exodeoxyribonuclease VII small subunit [Gloeocapsopsis dulcis]|uniref:Exodeoxyribonuclease 7 small subunit n=2 Tax=Gloeocapsopsis TaxID=693222 RepID=A0A6N8FUB6_9CHRO|nr:exodeoxyribonuclease VII small subunit [Gloeocapsopsis dulcis]MUL36541.1 exodeoxyribonuclease VII small subunit [Gloeocapsopsis dulcis AAB1 = 1H9]WNN87826.1 exodeoxyribonuclease VII small subunit [Gloeocapsopsis dulcis]